MEKTFANIYVKSAEEILKKAFKEATATIRRRRFIKDEESFVKTDSVERMKRFSESIRNDLVQVEKNFPNLAKMSDFYRETISSEFDLGELKKAIASLKGSAIVLRSMERKYCKKVWLCREKKKVGLLKKEFFGRASSFVKRNKKKLEMLKEFAKFVEKMPLIKEEFTVIIAGLPNVGKSTMLSRLTGSKPEIRNYPFTTKSIMMGYLKIGHEEVQFIDTPGILDKKPEERNEAEKRAVAALKHLADLIIYVADPSNSSGFSIKEQERLLESIKAEFPGRNIILVINKADSSTNEELEEAKAIFKGAFIAGYGFEEQAKEAIIEEIKKAMAEARQSRL